MRPLFSHPLRAGDHGTDTPQGSPFSTPALAHVEGYLLACPLWPGEASAGSVYRLAGGGERFLRGHAAARFTHTHALFLDSKAGVVPTGGASFCRCSLGLFGVKRTVRVGSLFHVTGRRREELCADARRFCPRHIRVSIIVQVNL